ncbi:thrombospondin type 3 repeat-containing protein [Chitinophaga oryzae]|uniref:Thrombospondin type 3 repeat-containing protein n=1 Tax=Chitinophaga oryzae TaxID=2725414 RepID=A0ABX6LFE6_9BACT|nr:thrombospondin type 3 repeat-containing protein [Chitinophaga oryzae]
MKTKFIIRLAVFFLLLIMAWFMNNFPEMLENTQKLTFADLALRHPMSLSNFEKSSIKRIGFDRDGDGVEDNVDKCPDTPANVIVDANGCPLDPEENGWVDSDHDGVPEWYDICPNTPLGTPVNTNGCPMR